MPRLNIAQLPFPPAEYRPDLLAHSFETEGEARNEDLKRVKLLRHAADLAVRPENRAAACDLADELDYGDGDPPESMASSLYMRKQRIRIGGALLQLADQFPAEDIVTFHLIPADSELQGPELANLDPRRKCQALLSDFNRYGISQSDGGISAFLDMEYEPNSDVWHPHFHGMAVGAKVDALKALRDSRKYRSRRYRKQQGRSVQRVRVLRKLTDLPNHLPYLVKSFWSSRWQGFVGTKPVRQRDRSRIPEPRHSQSMLWLDRWPLQNLCVLVGIEVGASGLRLSRKYTNGDGR